MLKQYEDKALSVKILKLHQTLSVNCSESGKRNEDSLANLSLQELDDIKDGKDNHQQEKIKNEKLYSLDDVFNLDPELFENKVFMLLIN